MVLPKGLHVSGQKLTNIYPLAGVGHSPYTILFQPKPLFTGFPAIGIKPSPLVSFQYHAV